MVPILDEMSLTLLTFEKEFTEAVEGKQLAQQEVERAQCVVEKVSSSRRQPLSAGSGFKTHEQMLSSLATAGDGPFELCKLKAAEEIGA